MTGIDAAGCNHCATPLWIGDQFCRSCGTRASGAGEGSSFHEIDLAGDADAPAPKQRVSLLALIGLVILGVAAIVGFRALIGGGADEPEATSELNPTPLPSSGLPDNPPEREAAQTAFETARERDDLTLAEVRAEFGIAGDIVILDRSDTSEWSELGRRAQPWGVLGPAEAAGYRIDARSRAVVQRWELGDSDASWTSTELTSVIPMRSIAVSPSHIATESGARVRIRDRETGEESASLAGRLIPSTGNGFLVQTCDPECTIVRLRADGVETGESLSADVYSPQLDVAARISPDGTTTAFVDGTAIIWDFEAGRSFELGGERVVDMAWLPDSSGLILLGPDSAWVQPLDGPGVALPIEVDAAWAIGLTTPER